MPKTVKRRKNKLAGRYRNRWPDEAEISGRMIPKWVADSCRNRWPDHPEICTSGYDAASRYLHQLFEAYQFKADEAAFEQRFKRFVVANNSRKALLNRLSDLL